MGITLKVVHIEVFDSCGDVCRRYGIYASDGECFIGWFQYHYINQPTAESVMDKLDLRYVRANFVHAFAFIGAV